MAAAVLGAVTGAVVLPDREPTVGTPSVTSTSVGTAGPSGSASPGPSTAPADPSSPGDVPGPVTSSDLLTVGDFADVGLALAAERSDLRAELVVCEKNETLDDLAASGPPVQQFWSAERVGATEQAIAARDEDEARTAVRRVLRTLEACQRAPAGHWVYGPTHRQELATGITISWLGKVDGRLNTAGRAPAGERINGGIAVLRNGSRVALLDVNWCQSAGDEAACVVAEGDAAGQLAELSRVAVQRLG